MPLLVFFDVRERLMISSLELQLKRYHIMHLFARVYRTHSETTPVESPVVITSISLLRPDSFLKWVVLRIIFCAFWHIL